MITTPNTAGQWGVAPLAGVHMDFEAWMASFKFDKNAYKKGAGKHPTRARPSRESFQRRLMLTPPPSPTSELRRRNNGNSSPPTLTPSSSSSSNTSTSSTASDAPPLFVTDFFEARRSPKGGYGAFAIKDVEAGTIIIAEKPAFRAEFMEVFTLFEKLPQEMRDEYRTLHGWKELSDHQVLAIFKTNRFETIGGKGGIFLKSSRFNHACHPFSTCTYSYDASQDRLIVKSLFSITKGQEITISYNSDPGTLYANYGFYCDCPACPSPAKAKAEAAFFRGPN